MRQWAAGDAAWWSQWHAGLTLEEGMVRIMDRLVACGGPLGLALRRACGSGQRPRQVGVAVEQVFPLPVLQRFDPALKGLRGHRRSATLAWANGIFICFDVFTIAAASKPKHLLINVMR